MRARASRRRIKAAAIAAASTCCAPALAAEPASARPAAETSTGAWRGERDAILDGLAILISSGIARQDTDRPVFHGNVDWHSAAHGHWALFRIARATGRHADLAAAADASLSPEGISAEARFLRENPYYEMPYGRAWFLRLAVEHEAWSRETGGADPLRLKPMADDAAKSLLDYYEQFKPTPFTHEYHSASWALAQLHEYFRRSGDVGGQRAAEAHVRRGFLQAGGPGFGADRSSPEFFSVYGGWAYLVAVSLGPEELGRFLAQAPPADPDLEPVDRLVPNPHSPSREGKPISHHFGMNWSRAWALKRLSLDSPAPADRARFAKAYRAHVDSGMRLHERHSGEFMAYGHWIPQFAVYALTEGDLP